MSSLTYPPAGPNVTQGGTALEIQEALLNPNIVTKRLYDITKERFLSDYLLTERPEAVGGSIILENGDEIFYMDDNPEAIAPGAEFPLSKSNDGTFQIVKTTKWGLDTEVTDESISRRRIDPVNKAFTKIGNTIIRYVDGVALSIIASRITSIPENTVTASGSWVGDGTIEGDHTAGARIVNDFLVNKALREEANQGFGYNYDTVVLKPSQHAKVMTYFMNSGMLPREANNAIASGVVEGILGLNWATSVHVPFTDPFIVDREFLGGIATENIQSPGYANRQPIPGGIPIEAKAIRNEYTEKWTIRGRRVEVPYVLDAKAGFRITGTGL
jgi:hypothetical protein